MQAQKSGRTVRANGSRILELRTRRGWTLADLALSAVCSEKTAESVEKGRPVYQSTLRKIAEALDTTPADLVAGGTLPPEPDRKDAPTHVVLQLSIDFGDLDESQHIVPLIEAITKFISAKEAIELRSAKPGSSIITLELSSDDAKALQEAIRAASTGKDTNRITINGITVLFFKSDEARMKLRDREIRKLLEGNMQPHADMTTYDDEEI